MALNTDDWKHVDPLGAVASIASGAASTTDACSEFAGYLSDDEEQPSLERTDTFTQYNESFALEWNPHPFSQVQMSGMMMVPTESCQHFESPTLCRSAGECGDTFSKIDKDELDFQPIGSNKEIMKLRKKLREIEQLQERVASGKMVDHLQRAKLEKHDDVLSELARLEGYHGTECQLSLASREWHPRTSTFEAFDVDIASEVPVDVASIAITEGGTDWSYQAFITQSSPFAWMPFEREFHEASTHTSGLEISGGSFGEIEYTMQPLRPAEQGPMFDLVEQAQLHAEARAAKETSWPRRRRHGTKYDVGMSHTEFAERVAMHAQGLQGRASVQEQTMAAIRDSAVQLALDAGGCRLLQHALENTDLHTAALLSSRLQGHVRELINSPHGNYVIQKVIEVLPIAQASFVGQELLGAGADFARHRFGCRVICRLLEHSAGDERKDDAVTDLVTEVVVAATNLGRHNFGHHVIQSVLEHGRSAQRYEVIRQLCRDLPRNLMNRNSSFVIDKVLTDCAAEERQVLLDEFALCSSEARTVLARGGRLGLRIAGLLSR
jgi:hypothetical protein